MSDKKHPHQDDKDLLIRLENQLKVAEGIIDVLTRRSVRLRLRIGQDDVQHEKVFHHGSNTKSILEIREAIKHVPLYEPSILKNKEDDTV